MNDPACLCALADAEKSPILKSYLDRFRREVHRFFPVPAGAPAEQFAALAPRYPAYELLPVHGGDHDDQGAPTPPPLRDRS